MSWKDVSKVIGNVAPVIGSLIGGPAGGAIGSVVSSLLGTKNSPDEIINALKTNPEALVKLKQYEMQHKEKLKELQLQAVKMQMDKDSADLSTVNATIRAEMAQQDNYTKRWRPTLGYAVTFSWVTTWLAIVYTIIFNTAYAQKVILAITQTTTLWSVALAILGVSVWKRSTDKAIIAGTTPSTSIVSKVIDKIKGNQ